MTIRTCALDNCEQILKSNQPKFCCVEHSTKNASKVAVEKKRIRRAEEVEDYKLNPKKCNYISCLEILPFEKRTNKYCSSSCAASTNNRLKTNESRLKQSSTLKQTNKSRHLATTIVLTLSYDRRIIVRVKYSKLGYKNSDKSKESIKQKKEYYLLKPNHCNICCCILKYERRGTKTCSRSYQSILSSNNAKKNNLGGFKNSSQLKRNIYDYCGYRLDSGAELYFAKMCNKMGITWIKNDYRWQKGFVYKKKEGKFYRYYPDFYLPQLNMWIEVKGKRYIRSDDPLRHAQIKDSKFRLVMSHEILNFFNSLERIVGQTIPHLDFGKVGFSL